MTFGNSFSKSTSSSGSKWPSRKIPSGSFASRRGDFSAKSGASSGSGFGSKFSKSDARSNARKKIIDGMSFEVDKDQGQKEKLKKEEAEKEFYKNLKLSDESKDVIDTLENSSENLFITGRAGTGKSTLLGYFRSTTKKNVVVVAPTGVAALNVRGQTIHGFFKFKIGMTVHDVKKITAEIDQKMYKKIDMLIIDEISMVRADMFDCIDRFLRLNGKNPSEPFGGVQIVVIGDLFQLPPVVGPGEGYIFETKYESPYFFDAPAYKQGNFQVIELTQVYRQQDPVFIDILDKIRTGEADMQHVEYINRMCLEIDGKKVTMTDVQTADVVIEDSLYVNDEGIPIDDEERDEEGNIVVKHEMTSKTPSSMPSKKEELIQDLKKQFDLSGIKGLSFGMKTTTDAATKGTDTSDAASIKKLTVYLVTTNALADKINTEKLEEIKTPSKTYKGALVGRFEQKNAPAPEQLVLKLGAQVMTLKNDPGGKWVNGDIGTVEKLLDASVRIRFEDGRVEEVIGDTWEMVRYEYDELHDQLDSEVVGKYTQIPIKLAWAVTIHKSQGKTFDTAIIDFGRGTFAHGQAYVALSRVRSLQGITLKNPLRAQDVRIDERIRDFLTGSR
ncbi:MAG: AAA family ATPase [Candidatus Pacebacteria bacterium]|nr:AAA family ATPase [Candidatus Paceibacterota bacterium]MBP9818636.1 AAA family ATPase [Candidatus Paceibacterota bacterium]